MFARVDPLGHTTTFVWEAGVVTAVIDAAGHRTSLGWDAAQNLVAITGADGNVSKRAYDALGRLVAITDAKGNTQRRHYDAAGRVLRIEEPDGNVREVARDGEGRVVRARDRLRDVTLGYAGMGWLASRTTAGATVRWRHDSEGRVAAVVDERGQEHRFERDGVGRVRIERGIGDVVTRFERDAAGRVVVEHRPGEVIVKHVYDAAGSLLETVYPQGGTERFGYDRAGRLVSAGNDDAVVELDRDAVGRIVKETTTRSDSGHADRGRVVVERKYDHRGLRIGVSSSLGAQVSLARDAMGEVLGVVQSGGAMAPWEASFGRDVLGDEIERMLPGGVRSTWWRDAQGRPTQHQVATGERAHRLRKYAWGADDRLLSIEEHGGGVQAFEHDGRGMLVATRIGESTVEGRWPDELGRIFDTPTRNDRAYGAGGDLQWRHGAGGTTRYTHDGEGRLATRVDPGGEVWRYWWSDAGRLAQVDRPDGTAVEFGYDALGRRLRKNAAGVQTSFVWDGQVVLHEWSEKVEAARPRAVPGEEARERALAEMRAELWRVLPEEEARARWEVQLGIAAKGFPGLVARLRAGEGSAGTAVADDVAGEVITWLFAPGSYAPMARLTAAGGHAIVTDQVGAPLLVVDAAGDAKAQLVTDSRGRARVVGDATLCPWRFAGQYLDEETGLHYNRMRYYDPDAGQYISRDPLGLRAGLRVYGYVGDPGIASDPLGLSPQAGAGCGGDAPRGANNPRTRAAAITGQEAHRQIEAELEAMGMKAEYPIDTALGPVRKDAFEKPLADQSPDALGMVVIIKPDTPSGRRSAARREALMRSERYDTATIFYDPSDPRYQPGSPTYVGPS